LPTKRIRRPRQRINQPMPAWVERLLTGELPELEGEDWGEFIAWKYFDEPTPGLPPAPSAEGRRLLAGEGA
jgi:hypothetical protein